MFRLSTLVMAVGTLLVVGAVSVGQAEIITFNAVEDNSVLTYELNTDYANMNYGACDDFRAGIFKNGSGQVLNQKGILRFDVSALGGVEGLEVTGITLNLTLEASPTITLSPELHQVSAANRAWIEGTGGNTGAVGNGESCWNYLAYDSTSWAGSAGCSTAGTDYSSTVLSSPTITAGAAAYSTVSFAFSGTSAELTSLINTWLNDNYTQSRANPGLVITNYDEPPTGMDYRVNFCSSEAAAAYSPQLAVTYNAVPEPGTITLLCAGLVGLVCYAWRKRK